MSFLKAFDDCNVSPFCNGSGVIVYHIDCNERIDKSRHSYIKVRTHLPIIGAGTNHYNSFSTQNGSSMVGDYWNNEIIQFNKFRVFDHPRFDKNIFHYDFNILNAWIIQESNKSFISVTTVQHAIEINTNFNNRVKLTTLSDTDLHIPKDIN